MSSIEYEVVSYVIYDSEDHTYHCGGDEWEEDRLQAERYTDLNEARQVLDAVDQKKILRDRLSIVEEGTTLSDPLTLASVLSEVTRVRDAQDRQWGGPAHDDNNAGWDWLIYITRHMGRAVTYGPRSTHKIEVLRTELVKIAAIAVAGIQSLDRIKEAVRESDEGT